MLSGRRASVLGPLPRAPRALEGALARAQGPEAAEAGKRRSEQIFNDFH